MSPGNVVSFVGGRAAEEPIDEPRREAVHQGNIKQQIQRAVKGFFSGIGKTLKGIFRSGIGDRGLHPWRPAFRLR